MKRLAVFFLVLAPPLGRAQEDDPLRIGLRESPRFVIQGEDGSIRGIAVDGPVWHDLLRRYLGESR